RTFIRSVRLSTKWQPVDRNRQQVDTLTFAIVSTVLLCASLGIIWRQNNERNRGRLRIETPAGLRVANVQLDGEIRHKFAGQSRDAFDAMLVTTPMPQAVDLPAGDYVVRIEGNGKVSENEFGASGSLVLPRADGRTELLLQ
ncbi:MAG: hypothetical protein KDA99_27575, partial [Planctomycetales bacterium]|nr:hypothetical protein [Planctomycetales bacterium]